MNEQLKVEDFKEEDQEFARQILALEEDGVFRLQMTDEFDELIREDDGTPVVVTFDRERSFTILSRMKKEDKTLIELIHESLESAVGSDRIEVKKK